MNPAAALELMAQARDFGEWNRLLRQEYPKSTPDERLAAMAAAYRRYLEGSRRRKLKKAGRRSGEPVHLEEGEPEDAEST